MSDTGISGLIKEPACWRCLERTSVCARPIICKQLSHAVLPSLEAFFDVFLLLKLPAITCSYTCSSKTPVFSDPAPPPQWSSGLTKRVSSPSSTAAGPALIAVWYKALPLTGSCL